LVIIPTGSLAVSAENMSAWLDAGGCFLTFSLAVSAENMALG
jgi:hypothetical protein